MPVARMALAPLLHPPDFLRSPEVVAVLRFSPPLALSGNPAGLSAIGSRTVPLMVTVPVVSSENPPATETLAVAGLDAHREPKSEEKPPALTDTDGAGEEQKGRRKNSSMVNHRKKNQRKNTNFSTARPVKYETAADIRLWKAPSLEELGRR